MCDLSHTPRGSLAFHVESSRVAFSLSAMPRGSAFRAGPDQRAARAARVSDPRRLHALPRGRSWVEFQPVFPAVSRPMITRTFALVALVTLLTMASPSYGQTPASAPADASDGLDVHGSVDVGYRSTTVKGSTDTFRQLFDLSDGPRIMGIEVNGKARDAVGSFADTFSLSASGLGGDPFPAVLLTVRKSRLYDLRANWRRSRLFDVWPATPPSIAGLDTQVVTDRHSWATSREIGNLAWTLHASNRLHFQFNYDRAVRTGTLQTTRSLDFVGAPTVWGSFARANPYPVIGPVDESANRITGGLSYGGNR